MKSIVDMLKNINLYLHVKVLQFSIREKHKKYGNLYPDKTFYVIRIRPIRSSLGPWLFWVLEELKRCEENEYIPIVDFSFYPNIFFEYRKEMHLNGSNRGSEVGKINPWEYYFEQPTRFSTRAVYHSRNVILGNADMQIGVKELDNALDNKLKEYCRLFEKYIHINKRIEKRIYKLYEDIIDGSKRILGCSHRGIDYRNSKVIGEHRQPSLQQEISKAQELMEEWKCDYIFLATEDEGAVEKFKEVFGDKLKYAKRLRYPTDLVSSIGYQFDREADAYLKGEEYLIDIYILSRCTCLMAGRSGILAATLPMNNLQYEHKYIFDLGLYTEDDYK